MIAAVGTRSEGERRGAPRSACVCVLFCLAFVWRRLSREMACLFGIEMCKPENGAPSQQ